MLKKLPLSLLAGAFALASYGQTIVSTSPENKNVVLEEFTGIHCVYCPQGHAVAKSIQDAHPDDVSLINIHTGGYANPGPGEPDFRTPYGPALVGQSGLTGYPGATVNRHVFPGRGMTPGGTAMGRGSWTASANETLALSSNVNVGVEASIDVQTRVLTVHVEAYYTANSPEATNLLNVALLQNNTLGPQIGGGMGDEYVHMHRLVELITGQWGEEITNTTASSFIDRTYTYTLPADYNGVPVQLPDMEVVAFISDTHQEIPSGNRAFPTYTGLTLANDASIQYIEDIAETCTNTVEPKVNIQNMGMDPITSLVIDYTVNGDSHSYTWSGNLTSLQNETVTLPEVTFTLQGTNTVVVNLPNDDDNSNNSASTDFYHAPISSGTLNMELQTDNYGSECRWYLRDGSGTIIANGGPYGNNQTITETFTLTPDCYSFQIRDTYGDGGASVTLTDHHGQVIYQTDGNYGNGETIAFESNGVLAVNDNQLADVSIYPNPASAAIFVKNAENADIQVFDVLGKLILSQNNIPMDAQLNVSQLQAGTYFMKIQKGNSVSTKKFLVVK